MARAIADGFAAPTVEDCFLRSSVLLDDAPTHDRFRAWFGLWAVALTRGDTGPAGEHVDVLASMADDAGDTGLQLQAMHARWTTQMFGQDLDGCLATLEAGLPLYRRERDHELGLRYGNHDPAVCGRALSALAAALQGDAARAERRTSDAVELATVLDHRPSIVQARALHCWSLQLAGDLDGVMEAARRCLELESDGAVPLWFGLARSLRSWASVVAGSDPRALAVLEREVAGQVEMRTRSWAAVHGSLLADAYTAVGRPRDALRVTDTTVLPDSRFYRCELTRARAEAIHGLGDRAAAVDMLLRAMGEARAWGAATLQLRSALALARVSPHVASTHVAAALALLPPGAQSPMHTAAEAAVEDRR